jgi:sirohydrochlorin cobaltochelatase
MGSLQKMKSGIVLFAHGSRDPLWSKPIEAIAQAISAASPSCEVRCAYLELMEPSLSTVVVELAAHDVKHIRIAPMFLGVGKHAREDLPELARELIHNYPELTFELMPSIGEHPDLIRAITSILTKSL